MRVINLKDVDQNSYLRCSSCGRSEEFVVAIETYNSDGSLTKLCQHCIAAAWDLAFVRNELKY